MRTNRANLVAILELICIRYNIAYLPISINIQENPMPGFRRFLEFGGKERGHATLG